KWDLLEVENKAALYLDEIRKVFTVEAAEINGYHNADYGKEWINGNATQVNLHALLKRDSLPRSFPVGVVLPYKDGKVENVSVFLNSIEKYQAQALAVPWLKRHLAAQPRTKVELRYVTDRSFSEKAMKIFTEDMRLGGKESLAKE